MPVASTIRTITASLTPALLGWVRRRPTKPVPRNAAATTPSIDNRIGTPAGATGIIATAITAPATAVASWRRSASRGHSSARNAAGPATSRPRSVIRSPALLNTTNPSTVVRFQTDEDAEAGDQVAVSAMRSFGGRDTHRRGLVDHQLRHQRPLPERPGERRRHDHAERERPDVEQEARDRRRGHGPTVAEDLDGSELRAAGEHEDRVADRFEQPESCRRRRRPEHDAERGHGQGDRRGLPTQSPPDRRIIRHLAVGFRHLNSLASRLRRGRSSPGATVGIRRERAWLCSCSADEAV